MQFLTGTLAGAPHWGLRRFSCCSLNITRRWRAKRLRAATAPRDRLTQLGEGKITHVNMHTHCVLSTLPRVVNVFEFWPLYLVCKTTTVLQRRVRYKRRLSSSSSCPAMPCMQHGTSSIGRGSWSESTGDSLHSTANERFWLTVRPGHLRN